MYRLAMFLMFAAACVPPVDAGVYKWKDKDGRLHYGDSPPPESKAAQVRGRINSIKGPAVVSDFTPKKEVSSEGAGGTKVRMFTTQSCGYCKRAKAYLNKRGTAFEELDVETSSTAHDEYQAMGGRGVPVIIVGNRRMNGFNADGLEGMLKESGL